MGGDVECFSHKKKVKGKNEKSFVLGAVYVLNSLNITMRKYISIQVCEDPPSGEDESVYNELLNYIFSCTQ